jgi:ribosomal 30S subunit maturation factor RimM
MPYNGGALISSAEIKVQNAEGTFYYSELTHCDGSVQGLLD